MRPLINSMFQEQLETLVELIVLCASDYDHAFLFIEPESRMVDCELPL